MGLLRWALLGGAAGYGTYLIAKHKPAAAERRELDGLCAVFPTREGADLAVEHLVQEYGVDRAFIYVEPVEDQNSSGVEISGGDAAADGRGHGKRPDAPLNGLIQLTVPVRGDRISTLKQALREVGAEQVEVF